MGITLKNSQRVKLLNVYNTSFFFHCVNYLFQNTSYFLIAFVCIHDSMFFRVAGKFALFKHFAFLLQSCNSSLRIYRILLTDVILHRCLCLVIIFTVKHGVFFQTKYFPIQLYYLQNSKTYSKEKTAHLTNFL